MLHEFVFLDERVPRVLWIVWTELRLRFHCAKNFFCYSLCTWPINCCRKFLLFQSKLKISNSKGDTSKTSQYTFEIPQHSFFRFLCKLISKSDLFVSQLAKTKFWSHESLHSPLLYKTWFSKIHTNYHLLILSIIRKALYTRTLSRRKQTEY